MGKSGKLTKLKSVIKRWPSISNLSRTRISVAAAETVSKEPLRAVYVGSSRRRYLLSSDIVDHPIFRELAEKSGQVENEDGLAIACEVVLFEHLLWMLENGGAQLGSMDDLAQFYTC